jgi:hypothetical protein
MSRVNHDAPTPPARPAERPAARTARLSATAGLCGSCSWQRVVVSGKGSTFSLCQRAAMDPSMSKYPHLPVLTCESFAPRRFESSTQHALTAQSDEAPTHGVGSP